MSDSAPTAPPSSIPSPTCPTCGTVLDSANTDAPCPACLMSGVLKDQDETQTYAAPPGRRLPSRPARDLPCDLGDYTLLSRLGQGGMGTVYEAEQRSTGRRLALKVLGQNLDTPEMRRRFLREGRLAARVNHPASLYVFGSEEIDGIPVITMEIAPGGTLQDALDRRGPLPVADAVDAVLHMIDGLEAALERGVLHRDIKPSNCFVAPDGTVKVGDFGLSVSTLPSLETSRDTFATQGGRVMGTPAFASPEQLRGDDVDARSDLYSVGATLFTLLTDRAPFPGDNAVQVVANAVDTPPSPVSDFRDDLPPGLAPVITRCLAKEPGSRYADYAALRDALLPFGSAVPEPATEAQRTAAGWIDYLAAFLPTYAALMVTVGPEALFIRPLYVFTPEAWCYPLLVFAAGLVYFALTEGLWGAGLGKWIMSLRVVRTHPHPTGRRPGVARAALRILIPIVLIECVRIPLTLATLPSGEWGLVNILLLIGLAIGCPWIAALLWIPARRSNGFATGWDLATDTRVVVRPRGTRRPGVAPRRAPDAQAAAEAPRCIGPFRVTSEVAPGHWLAADDPVLRRGVWLIRRGGLGGHAPSAARRAAARPGRPRWLQEIETDGAVWDVFEASRGTPFTEHTARGPVPWSTVRYWLHDLAAELHAARHEATLPDACRLDEVWITDDGRAVLLDAPWPHGSASGGTPAAAPADLIPVDTLDGQQRFLQAVAQHVDPVSVPVHAQPVLHNLRAASFEKLTFLTGTLRGLLNKPADVTRSLRAASMFIIPGYAWIATLLGIAANTDPSVGPRVWAGRIAIAGLVMLNFIAFFDVLLAFWRKTTGLTTFGLEVVTVNGRASRTRMLTRCAILWLPVVGSTGVLAAVALSRGTGISFRTAAALGAAALTGAAVFAASALIHPTRGLHDRLAGVWVGRR